MHVDLGKFSKLLNMLLFYRTEEKGKVCNICSNVIAIYYFVPFLPA